MTVLQATDPCPVPALAGRTEERVPVSGWCNHVRPSVPSARLNPNTDNPRCAGTPEATESPRPILPPGRAVAATALYLLLLERVRLPVFKAISKWVCRQTSQSCCPWNVRFSQELKEPAFASREVLAGKDARTLARELLAMGQDEFSRAFKHSPMKRAKLRGLKRSACVVLGNVGHDGGRSGARASLGRPRAARARTRGVGARRDRLGRGGVGTPGSRLG